MSFLSASGEKYYKTTYKYSDCREEYYCRIEYFPEQTRITLEYLIRKNCHSILSGKNSKSNSDGSENSILKAFYTN